ncbi:RIMB1-like protein, partial [Mya arenaria]
MECMRERNHDDYDDGRYGEPPSYEDSRGFAVGDYWNLTTYGRPETPQRFKNRKQEERDRQLQKKVSELQTQTQRLERKIALLKTENETLKRKQDDKKPLEEKIKTLKKRNAELAAIARRLEEKAKHLQQENVKDQMKKLFARQRAKDLSEHAKQMLSKDREIEDLRKK